MDLLSVAESPLLGNALLGVVLFLIAFELVVYVVKRRAIDIKESAASWAIGIGYFLIVVTGSKILYYGALFYVYENFRFWTVDPTNPWNWLALFLIGDFYFYWWHRLEHRCRFFWCAHENHHSAREYTFSTAVRMPWAQLVFDPILILWKPLLGFHPVMYALVDSVNMIADQLLHTRLIGKLGVFEKVFNTPSHHRVHHGSDLEYLDSNYGSRLIIWDRMFGTFSEEQQEPRYGLTKDVGSYNPFRIVVHGYLELWRDVRDAARWIDKVMYLWKPPGWRHDGPSQSSDARRARLAAATAS